MSPGLTSRQQWPLSGPADGWRITCEARVDVRRTQQASQVGDNLWGRTRTAPVDKLAQHAWSSAACMPRASKLQSHLAVERLPVLANSQGCEIDAVVFACSWRAAGWCPVAGAGPLLVIVKIEQDRHNPPSPSLPASSLSSLVPPE